MLIWPRALRESTAAPPLLISLPQQITWPAPYSISRARSLSRSLTHSRLWNRQRSDEALHAEIVVWCGSRTTGFNSSPAAPVSGNTARATRNNAPLELYSLRARRHEIWFATSLLLANLDPWRTSQIYKFQNTRKNFVKNSYCQLSFRFLNITLFPRGNADHVPLWFLTFSWCPLFT